MVHHKSNELELEALVRALGIFRPWIFGKPVVVFTDNAATFFFAFRQCGNLIK